MSIDWGHILQTAERSARAAHRADKEHARDIAQDTIVRILEWGKLEEYENQRAVVSMIARNKAINYRNSAIFRKRVSLSPTIVDSSPTHDSVVELRDELAAAMSKLSTRPKLTQKIVYMRCFDEMSIAEISAEIGLSDRSIRDRLMDARRTVGAVQRKRTAERNAEIVRLVKSGELQAAVGRRFGLTGARVSQILKASKASGE